MKQTFITFSIALLAVLALAFSAAAQPQGQRPGSGPESEQQREPMPSVEQMAKDKTDLMNQEIGLDEKQYKKVLKLYKSQIQEERDLMEAGKPEGMPDGFPGGFPGGGPGMGNGPRNGGGPSMGGGRPPMGGSGPQGGFGNPGEGGERPAMGGRPMGQDDEALEALYEKGDKKLKKILTPEQYSLWRSKHPVQRVPMPEIEWQTAE